MKRARRDLLKRTAALSAAAGAAAFVHPSAIRSARAAMTIDKIKMALAKHKGEVLTLCTWGGTTADAFREAYFKPFSEEFGIEVVEDAPPTNAKIVAMVKSGHTTWDLCDIGAYKSYGLGSQGYLEEVDYSVMDTTGMPGNALQKWGVGNYSWALVLVYNTEVYTDNKPSSIEDVFDVKRFPGKRSLRDHPVMNICYAAQAAGATPQNLYPLTEMKIKDAYRKLEEIQSDVIWWKAGAQSQQLISIGEVDMALMWNGRVDKLIEDGHPLEMVWKNAQFATASWVQPKGAPSKRVADLFCGWYIHPENNARFSDYMTSGPVNTLAFDKVKPQQRHLLPSTYVDQMGVLSNAYWGPNLDDHMNRWKEWRLG